jgi:hypothetical protein
MHTVCNVQSRIGYFGCCIFVYRYLLAKQHVLVGTILVLPKTEVLLRIKSMVADPRFAKKFVKWSLTIESETF